MLFALPAAFAVAIIAGVLVGGPGVGFLVAGVIAVAVVVVAIQMEPRGRRTAAADAPVQTGAHGWRGAAARRFLVPLAIAAVGIVLVVATTGAVRVIGWGVVAVAITVAMSLVFLEIGFSEDRARAREDRAAVQPRRRRRDRPPVR
jgi:hypothetical protein